MGPYLKDLMVFFSGIKIEVNNENSIQLIVLLGRLLTISSATGINDSKTNLTGWPQFFVWILSDLLDGSKFGLSFDLSIRI